MLCALIMAGGKGTRFWPMSTEKKPKQFIRVVGDKTMIQMTVDRIKPIIPAERIFICTIDKYVDLIKTQIPEIPEANIIIEPEGRNTAPCITLSSLYIERKYNNATMLVLPADHLITDTVKFLGTIIRADEFVNRHSHSIITLGMEPDRPETGYGYIKCCKKPEIKDDIFMTDEAFVKVENFVEKPCAEKAVSYLKDGNYLWNGGIFMWKIQNIITLIREFCPAIYEVLKEVKTAEEKDLKDIVSKNYYKTTAISIDYAVLEKAEDIYVIPCRIGWDDMGKWEAVQRYKDKDEFDNIIEGNAQVIDGESNIVLNNCDNNKRVVLIGVKDVMEIQTDDTVYIVNKQLIGNLRDYRELVDNI